VAAGVRVFDQTKEGEREREEGQNLSLAPLKSACTHAQVPIGRAGTRVLCPLVNRSEQTLCFELLTATSEHGGAGCGDHNNGVVRIDNGDQELQLLKKFHMCRFVEAHAQVPHSADSSSTASQGRSW
jgi:hypothetical protein